MKKNTEIPEYLHLTLIALRAEITLTAKNQNMKKQAKRKTYSENQSVFSVSLSWNRVLQQASTSSVSQRRNNLKKCKCFSPLSHLQHFQLLFFLLINRKYLIRGAPTYSSSLSFIFFTYYFFGGCKSIFLPLLQSSKRKSNQILFEKNGFGGFSFEAMDFR